MVVLVRVRDAEAQHDATDEGRIRKCSPRTAEIGSGAELDFVNTARECVALEQRTISTPIGVRECARDTDARIADPVYGHLDARPRPTQRSVENVCRQATHADLAQGFRTPRCRDRRRMKIRAPSPTPEDVAE